MRYLIPFLILLIMVMVVVTIHLDIYHYVLDFHLGDIAYTLIVYLLFHQLLRSASIKLRALLTILIMLLIEFLQYLTLGQQLFNSNHQLLQFVGKYIVGMQLSWFEMGIYVLVAVGLFLLETHMLNENLKKL